MDGRIFGIASLVSVILLSCTMLLWLGAFVLNPAEHSLSVTDDFHIGIWDGFRGLPFGCIVFFNDKEYGPYQGSIVTLCDKQGNPARPLRKNGWGPACGVYYRHFRWLDTGATLWTLMISLAYPMVLFSIMPTAWLWRRLYKRR